MGDYEHYRTINNYPTHINKAEVEAKTETVQSRKTFFAAETEWFAGYPEEALKVYGYDEKTGRAAALERWRDILMRHKLYREDTLAQEQAFEIQLNFMAVLKKAD